MTSGGGVQILGALVRRQTLTRTTAHNIMAWGIVSRVASYWST